MKKFWIRMMAAIMGMAVSAVSAQIVRAAQAAKPPAAAAMLQSQRPAVRQKTEAVQIPAEGIIRQMKQLQRAQHLLELSSGNDPTTHAGTAARHLQMAIDDLKLELRDRAEKERAQGAAANHVKN